MKLTANKLKSTSSKSLLLLIALLFTLTPLMTLTQPAQALRMEVDYGYTKAFGGTGTDVGRGVASDAQGNAYVTGGFADTVNFHTDGGTDIHTSSGGQDVYITKFNTDGSYGWTKTFGGTAADQGYGIITDSQGNVYIAGDFGDTINFHTDGGTDIHTSNGALDAFLTKINSNGSYGWTKTFGGTGSDRGQGITTDNQDNIYITGDFVNTVNFHTDGGTDEHTSAGGLDAFVAKINSNGSYGWTNIFGGTANDQGRGLTADPQGNLYVTGGFRATSNFHTDGGSDEHTSNGVLDTFITKLNANGSYGWTKTFGGSGNDLGWSMVADSQDNVYITGWWFSDTVNFHTGGGTDEHTGAGGNEGFITKLSANGSYGWTKTFGGASNDQGLGAVTDTHDNIYITGNYSDTVNFHTDGGTDEHTSPAGNDGFITKLNANGSYGWTKSFGSASEVQGRSISIDANSNLYVAGWFNDTANFHTDGGTDEHTSGGALDAYITKLNQTTYHHITGLPTGLRLIDPSTGFNMADQEEGGAIRSSDTVVRLETTAGIPIADINVDLTSDRDWSDLSAATDAANHKSVVANLSSMDGFLELALYIPKDSTHNQANICPEATTLDEVNSDCDNLATSTEDDDNTTVATVNDKTYWLVSGLTGTGGYSDATVPGLPDTGYGLNSTSYLNLLIALTTVAGLSGVYYVRRTRKI